LLYAYGARRRVNNVNEGNVLPDRADASRGTIKISEDPVRDLNAPRPEGAGALVGLPRSKRVAILLVALAEVFEDSSEKHRLGPLAPIGPLQGCA
jgi:hypothetical protein